MGFFDGLLKKIPFVSRFSKKKEPVNNVELQFNKAMNLMDNGDAEESVNILEQVADIGIMDAQYKSGMMLFLHLQSSMRRESTATQLWMWI